MIAVSLKALLEQILLNTSMDSSIRFLVSSSYNTYNSRIHISSLGKPSPNKSHTSVWLSLMFTICIDDDDDDYSGHSNTCFVVEMVWLCWISLFIPLTIQQHNIDAYLCPSIKRQYRRLSMPIKYQAPGRLTIRQVRIRIKYLIKLTDGHDEKDSSYCIKRVNPTKNGDHENTNPEWPCNKNVHDLYAYHFRRSFFWPPTSINLRKLHRQCQN